MQKKKSNIGRRPKRCTVLRRKRQEARLICNAKLTADSKVKINVPFCVVCKKFQTPQEELNANVYDNDDSDDDIAPPAHNRGKIGTRWVTTQEATPVSGSPVIFKLFEVLQEEFTVGSVCAECYHIVEQLDAVKFQTDVLMASLKSRVGLYHSDMVSYEVNCSVTAKELPNKTHRAANNDLKQAAKAMLGTQFTAMRGLKRSKLLMQRTKEKHMTSRRHKLVRNEKEFEERLDKEKVISNGSPTKEGTNLLALSSVDQGAIWNRWIDPRHVEHVLMRGNFDYDFLVNKRQMLYRGHVFEKHLNNQTVPCHTDEIITRWVCQNSYINATKCPVILISTLNNECVLAESVDAEHNHPVVEESYVFKNFWGLDIKRISLNHPQMTDHQIIEVLSDMHPEIPKSNTMLALVSRLRNNF